MANFVSNDNATSLMNAINQKKDSKPGTITWAEWIALTDEQREGTHYIITNVPAKFSDKDAVFSIKDQTLTFTNKTATVTDSRITADTYIFTFYHNQAVAQAAGIECSWTTGTVTFTVDENPSENIVVDILCILPALATPPSEGGGHVIVDQDGMAMAQEDAMQFPDSHVSDDSVNGRTVVENVKSVASADYSSETDDGMYLIPDGEGAVIEPASDDKVEVTADGVKSWTTVLNELFAQIDIDKVTKYSKVIFTSINGVTELNLEWKAPTLLRFFTSRVDGDQSTKSYSLWLSATGSAYNTTSGIYDTEILASGSKFVLYYGNKKATVDLQTTANRCWMADGTNIQQRVGNKNFGTRVNIASYTSSANKYTCPSDGYVRFEGTGGVSLELNDVTMFQSTNLRTSIYVRKGMTVWFSTGTLSVAEFIPLTQ